MPDQTVLITGASRGIGREFAKLFASNGYKLILTARNFGPLEETRAALIKKYKSEIHVIAEDLAQPAAVENLYKSVQDLGLRVDILVNNAAVETMGRFDDIPWQEQEQLLSLNITNLSRLTYLLLPAMMARKSGKILNVASNAAFVPGPYKALYFASKAFVLSFSLALAEEYIEHNITVTALCPGLTNTGFEKLPENKQRSRRAADPADVARLGYNALMSKRRIAIYSLSNKLIYMASRLLPPSLLTKMVIRHQRRKLP